MDSSQNKTLNMNKFFGENYSQVTSPKNSFEQIGKLQPIVQPQVKSFIEDIETALAPLKSDIQNIDSENENQNNILQKITSSFDGLISSAEKIKTSTEKFIKIVNDDAIERKKDAKTEESEWLRQKQKSQRRTKKLSAGELFNEKTNDIAAIGAGAAAAAGLAAAAGSLINQMDNGGPSPGGSNNYSPTGIQGEIYKYLMSKGLDDTHALGIMANISRESSFNPAAIGDKGSSGGLFQWHKERFSNMSSKIPNWKTNWKAQIDYALSEPGEPSGEYLRSTFSSPQQAADWWMNKWEKPAESVRNSTGPESHKNYLEQVEKYRKNNPSSSQKPSQSSTPKGSSPQASSATSSDTKLAAAKNDTVGNSDATQTSTLASLGLSIEDSTQSQSTVSPKPSISIPLSTNPPETKQPVMMPLLAQATSPNLSSAIAGQDLSSPQSIRDPKNAESYLSASARGVFLNA